VGTRINLLFSGFLCFKIMNSPNVQLIIRSDLPLLNTLKIEACVNKSMTFSEVLRDYSDLALETLDGSSYCIKYRGEQFQLGRIIYSLFRRDQCPSRVEVYLDKMASRQSPRAHHSRQPIIEPEPVQVTRGEQIFSQMRAGAMKDDMESVISQDDADDAVALQTKRDFINFFEKIPRKDLKNMAKELEELQQKSQDQPPQCNSLYKWGSYCPQTKAMTYQVFAKPNR